jgi:ankyrin repeat protein
MSLQVNLMVLFMLGGLLAGCSKGLPPSVMPAVMKADSKNVQASLRKGANVNEKDSRGMTALMIASARGDTEIVQALLDISFAISHPIGSSNT